MLWIECFFIINPNNYEMRLVVRLRNITGADETIEQSKYVIQNPETLKNSIHTLFQNKNQPLQIEIGMGKGRFIMDLASMNPTINYIGIEKYSSVLLRALQKMEERNLDNLLFMCEDARELPDFFGKEEIDKIYLNFSDPWPKDRHAKRRLVSNNFLMVYKEVLKRDGLIEFKTDNRELFDFGLEQIQISEYELLDMTYDLHQDEKLSKNNIMTEYEEKFHKKGNPICKFVIRQK